MRCCAEANNLALPDGCRFVESEYPVKLTNEEAEAMLSGPGTTFELSGASLNSWDLFWVTGYYRNYIILMILGPLVTIAVG